MRGCRRGLKADLDVGLDRLKLTARATGSGHGWPYGSKGNTFQKWVTETSPLSAAKRYVTSSLSCPDHSIAKGRTAHGSPSGSKHEGTAHGPVQALEAREPGRAPPNGPGLTGSRAHGGRRPRTGPARSTRADLGTGTGPGSLANPSNRPGHPAPRGGVRSTVRARVRRPRLTRFDHDPAPLDGAPVWIILDGDSVR